MISLFGHSSTRNRSGTKYGYTALFPIKDAECSVELQKTLEIMGSHERGSPFSDVPLIHLARLIVWDNLPFQGYPAKTDRLEASYLIFMCDFDGSEVSELAGSLAKNAPDLVNDVWGRCCNFPFASANWTAMTGDAADRLSAYFTRYQVETSLFLSDRPDATVDEILRCIKLQVAFARFVEANQTASAKTLQNRFRTFWEKQKKSGHPVPGRLPWRSST
jgi:hypothetical protein